MRSMRFTISALLLLVVSQGIAETPFYGRFAITQGDARVGENFTLTLTIKALIDLPDIAVHFEIPEGIEILSDSLFPIDALCHTVTPLTYEFVYQSPNRVLIKLLPTLLLHQMTLSIFSKDWSRIFTL